MNISRSQLEQIIREVIREVEAVTRAGVAAEAPPEAASARPASLRTPLVKAAPPPIASPDALAHLQATTAARIGIGRAGARYRTAPYLDFLQAHAAARDAVLGEVPDALIEQLGLLTVASRAGTKGAYLTDPELGRQLSDEGRQLVQQQGTRNARLQVIVIDGLSSAGIITQIPALMEGISGLATREGYAFGTPAIFVRHGRLGVTNEIGELLAPDVALSLVGERPGLVTAESVSAYITWRPSAQTTDAERNLVSNIHEGGTPAPQALEHIAELMRRVYAQGASGVALT